MGEAFARAFGVCERWLLLSGTPFRSDATPIPGVRYDSDGLAQPDVSYAYADAVLDGICRPVCFVAYDGTLSWRSGDDVIESSFETVLSAREASRRYRTAISADLPDGLPRILREADAKLRTVRAGGHRDAGGLVIAADSTHARRIAALLREATGQRALVVLHTEPRAAEKLAAFTNTRDPWIVAVNMVSEGVDIPRLRVGVYASAAKTPLVFRQIVGRFVRTIPHRPAEPSWLYIPADPILRDHAATVQQELRHALRPAGDEFAGEFDRTDSLQTERGETPAFEPLSAYVTPQLTLFGTPAPPATQHTSVAATNLAADPDLDPGRTGRRRSNSARGCETSATGSSPSSPAVTEAPTARSTAGSTERSESPPSSTQPSTTSSAPSNSSSPSSQAAPDRHHRNVANSIVGSSIGGRREPRAPPAHATHAQHRRGEGPRRPRSLVPPPRAPLVSGQRPRTSDRRKKANVSSPIRRPCERPHDARPRYLLARCGSRERRVNDGPATRSCGVRAGGGGTTGGRDQRFRHARR